MLLCVCVCVCVCMCVCACACVRMYFCVWLEIGATHVGFIFCSKMHELPNNFYYIAITFNDTGNSSVTPTFISSTCYISYTSKIESNITRLSGRCAICCCSSISQFNSSVAWISR